MDDIPHIPALKVKWIGLDLGLQQAEVTLGGAGVPFGAQMRSVITWSLVAPRNEKYLPPLLITQNVLGQIDSLHLGRQRGLRFDTHLVKVHVVLFH